MARVVVGVYMVRYPLGGMLSWALQYLIGLQQAGHEVTIVEKGHYRDACFDTKRCIMTDDPTMGLAVVRSLLDRHGLGDRLGYVDFHGRSYGLSHDEIAQAFRDADLFIDCGTHGAWLSEARDTETKTVMVDGEPGYSQIRWQKEIDKGEPLPCYDHHFSNGMLLGTDACHAPTHGRTWKHVFNPVFPALFETDAHPPKDACVTTVMNWKAHADVTYQGRVYGQKNMMFEDFISLPSMTQTPLEVAIGGEAPFEKLDRHGWLVRQGHEITTDFNTYRAYIHGSLAEFSICKHIFVAMQTGWFSDRSGAYLASGRPVILQDTGFSRILPCGEGLFAVNTVEEAAAAIDSIKTDYARHSKAAKSIACEYLSADRVMAGLVEQVLAN